MQTRTCDENSVRPSVCLSVRPSVRQMRELWRNGRKICLDFYTIRKIIYPSFLREKNCWWGANPSTWNFGSTGPRWSEIADFEPIIARSASSVRSSEKSSINTNRKSPTRFPTSLRWSSYVAPTFPKGRGLKTQNGRFSSIIELRLKIVCYLLFFVWKLSAAKL